MLDKDTQAIIDEINNANELWILKDEHGCVMLTTEDEDGVPVWCSKADASAWANEDWSHCEAISISLKTWKEKWTTGLTEDDLTIMVNPSELQENGIVLLPQEFDEALNK